MTFTDKNYIPILADEFDIIISNGRKTIKISSDVGFGYNAGSSPVWVGVAGRKLSLPSYSVTASTLGEK